MPERTKPPFRADHVGSLIRPDALIAARAAAEEGKMPPAELTRIQHEAIRGVVRLQEDIGLKLATDGEYNRFSWQRDFLLKIGNVRPMASKLTVRFHSAAGTRDHSPPSLQVAGKLSRPTGIFVDDFKFLKSVAAVTPKITIPSPTIVHFRGGREAIDAKAYPEMDAFYDDLAESIARKSATSPTPAAAICRSTRSISLICAIRNCAARSPISARTRRRCRRPTPSCSTPRSPASLTT